MNRPSWCLWAEEFHGNHYLFFQSLLIPVLMGNGERLETSSVSPFSLISGHPNASFAEFKERTKLDSHHVVKLNLSY